MELYVARVPRPLPAGRAADFTMRRLELRSCGRRLASYLNQGNKWIAPAFYGLLAELEAASRGPDSALTLIDEGLAIARRDRRALLGPLPPSATRRHPAEARSRRSRTRRRSLSGCHRRREAAGRAQLMSCSRRFRSRSFTNRPPPRRRPRRPRARARRLFADAGNAGDRRGAGAARGAGGDGGGQGRRGATTTPAASANGLRPGDDVAKGFAAEETKAAFARASRARGQSRRLCGTLRGLPRSMDLGPRARRTAAGARAGFAVPEGSGGRGSSRGSGRRPPRPRLELSTFPAISSRRGPIASGRSRPATLSATGRRGNASATTPGPWRCPVLAVTIVAIGRGRSRARIDRRRRTGARSELGHAPSMAHPLAMEIPSRNPAR